MTGRGRGRRPCSREPAPPRRQQTGARACSSQLRAKCVDEGRVQRSPVHRNGEPRAAQLRRPGPRSRASDAPPRASVPIPRPAPGRRRWGRPPWRGSPAISGYSPVSPAIQTMPDGPRTSWPLASLGRCGMGRLTMLGRHLAYLDSAAHRGPAVPQGNRVHLRSATQPVGVRRRAHQDGSRAASAGSAVRRGRGAGGRRGRRRAGSTTPGPAGVPGAAAARHEDEAADRSGPEPRPDPEPPRSGQAR